MGIAIEQHASIWTQEVALCALRSVPGWGKVAEVTHGVRQRYNAIHTEDRLSTVESELTAFHAQMRDLVEQAVSEAMETLKQPSLDGTTLTRLVKEFKSTNEAGYNTALFEGLFLGTSHHESLKQMPQSYGSVLDPGATMEPGHFPIMIELDGQDRILAVPPASLSQVLSEVSGQGDSRIITTDDIFAVPDRSAETTQSSSINEEQIEHPTDTQLGEPVRKEKKKKKNYTKRVQSATRKNAVPLLKSKISAYSDSLRSDQFLRERARAYATEGSYRSAISDYTEALRLNPEDWTLYQERAGAYEKMRDYKAVVSDCNEILRRYPYATYPEAKLTQLRKTGKIKEEGYIKKQIERLLMINRRIRYGPDDNQDRY